MPAQKEPHTSQGFPDSSNTIAGSIALYGSLLGVDSTTRPWSFQAAPGLSGSRDSAVASPITDRWLPTPVE